MFSQNKLGFICAYLLKDHSVVLHKWKWKKPSEKCMFGLIFTAPDFHCRLTTGAGKLKSNFKCNFVKKQMWNVQHCKRENSREMESEAQIKRRITVIYFSGALSSAKQDKGQQNSLLFFTWFYLCFPQLPPACFPWLIMAPSSSSPAHWLKQPLGLHIFCLQK